MTNLYSTDFNLWTEQTIAALKSGDLQALDLDNLIEEIEAMTCSDKREIFNRLKVLIMHLLKCQYQKKTNSWIKTINEQRDQIELVLADSPSLRPYLTSTLEEIYKKAKRDAVTETKLTPEAFPTNCPFTEEQILDSEYFPN